MGKCLVLVLAVTWYLRAFVWLMRNEFCLLLVVRAGEAFFNAATLPALYMQNT